MAEFRNAFAALDSASDGEGPAKPIATKKQADIDRSKQLRKSTNVRKGKEAKHNAVAPKAASKGGDHSGNHHKRAPRREHDRRSGTGRGREGKKGGAGGHNWGKPGDDAAQEPASVDPVDGEEAQATEEVEPAVKELTLEDYEAERAAKRQGELFSRVSVRKGDAITEGVAYAKKKAADLENDAFIAMGEKKDKKKRERNQNKKKVLQTNFSIRDESAPSSDFGEAVAAVVEPVAAVVAAAVLVAAVEVHAVVHPVDVADVEPSPSTRLTQARSRASPPWLSSKSLC
eukprot:CAMPEP_0184522400 /NCGR_PEP_ID=MMETSP0198_2-20121128/8260_1 /TAXON_ID=1112570 /ORGANISM="Thraustochytrium sp., Strain LLF1b" /LENGTH=286 /DNA_ID=CAMNT_0026913221 /DNA_START=1146 /DNA_END=2010 /DNA_ORIENTATION=-